jgi:KaiC/GvpD/RAD55 family RecA-like ATPase
MNLTITVDGDLLKRARIRALQEDTSVNSVLRQFLEAYAGMGERRRDAVADLLALSETARSRRGSAKWTRDELYER